MSTITESVMSLNRDQFIKLRDDIANIILGKSDVTCLSVNEKLKKFLDISQINNKINKLFNRVNELEIPPVQQNFVDNLRLEYDSKKLNGGFGYKDINDLKDFIPLISTSEIIMEFYHKAFINLIEPLRTKDYELTETIKSISLSSTNLDIIKNYDNAFREVKSKHPEINIHMKQFNKDTEISSRVYSQLIDCCHDIISVEQRGIIKKNSETTHELKLIVSYNDRDYMKEIEMEYSTSSGRIITIPRHYKIIELKSFDSIFSTKSLESTKNVLKTNTDYNDEFIDSIDNLLMAGFDNDMFRIAYQNNRVSKGRKVIIENESDINRTRELIHQNVEKYLKNNDDIYTVIVDSNTKLEVLTQLRDKGCVLYDEHPGF